MEAATYSGIVNLTLRNGGTATLNYTVGGELAGNGQRSISSATIRLAPGRNVRVPLMRVWVGSLTGSVLTVSGTACARAD